MLPKEVKNGHIAESQKPVEPKERDCKALYDFDKLFHRSRLLGKHLLTVFEVKAAPAVGFIVAALHQEPQ